MSSPSVESTGVCALPSYPQADTGCPGHLWKWEESSEAQHFPWSRMSLHTLPAQRCPIPGDLGGCSCNRNKAPQRLGSFQPSLSHIALMQPDKYISLYPAPLTLRLISKPDSAQPSSWALNATCQHHLPGTAARLSTWQRCRIYSSFHPVPQEATLLETL